MLNQQCPRDFLNFFNFFFIFLFLSSETKGVSQVPYKIVLPEVDVKMVALNRAGETKKHRAYQYQYGMKS